MFNIIYTKQNANVNCRTKSLNANLLNMLIRINTNCTIQSIVECSFLKTSFSTSSSCSMWNSNSFIEKTTNIVSKSKTSLKKSKKFLKNFDKKWKSHRFRIIKKKWFIFVYLAKFDACFRKFDFWNFRIKSWYRRSKFWFCRKFCFFEIFHYIFWNQQQYWRKWMCFNQWFSFKCDCVREHWLFLQKSYCNLENTSKSTMKWFFQLNQILFRAKWCCKNISFDHNHDRRIHRKSKFHQTFLHEIYCNLLSSNCCHENYVIWFVVRSRFKFRKRFLQFYLENFDLFRSHSWICWRKIIERQINIIRSLREKIQKRFEYRNARSQKHEYVRTCQKIRIVSKNENIIVKNDFQNQAKLEQSNQKIQNTLMC